MKNFLLLLVLSCFLSILISECSPNKPWRTAIEPQTCDEKNENCSSTIWEIHPNYELAFIEFTERGNVFSNEYSKAVYDRLREYNREQNLAIIVFVHGWKHNASSDDANVISFRKALDDVSQSLLAGSRKLIGVYIGWRGMSLHGLGLENFTYWDRKAVAQEVGKGGVTDVFVELEKIDSANPSNYMFIIGHSFGGAITQSALNEIFLERLKSAYTSSTILRGFGEGTVIINPAIEANQILQLKEASMLLGGENDYQPNLLHVLSSKGDAATHQVFPLGQALGVGLTWQHEELKRNYNSQEYCISEYELDVNTAGNFELFHTSALIDLKDSSDRSKLQIKEQFGIDLTKRADVLGQWAIHSYCSTPITKPGAAESTHLPCHDNEAISFTYTSKSFIEDHNDVFNENVMAYFSTLVSEAIFKQNQNRYYKKCADGKSFFFESCFNHHWKRYTQN